MHQFVCISMFQWTSLVLYTCRSFIEEPNLYPVYYNDSTLTGLDWTQLDSTQIRSDQTWLYKGWWDQIRLGFTRADPGFPWWDGGFRIIIHTKGWEFTLNFETWFLLKRGVWPKQPPWVNHDPPPQTTHPPHLCPPMLQQGLKTSRDLAV